MNELIDGKANVSGIVGLEVTDGSVELFIQDEEGNVHSEFRNNRFWILSNKPLDRGFNTLDGDLFYKYGRQYELRSDFSRMRMVYKNAGHDVFSIYNPEEACMVKDGYCFYQGMKQRDVSLISFDLETTGLNGKATDAKILLISTTYRDKHTQVNKLFSYDEYEDEGKMLEDFCLYIREKNPSLLIGHNILTYDFPYLRARADTAGISLDMGRNGSPILFDTYTSNFRMDGTRSLEYNNVKIYGREVVDTYFLASAFDVSKSIESYALKPMIKQLGLEKEGRQYYDASLIRKNYTDLIEFVKIKQYATEDSEDAVKIFDQMGPLYFNMAPMFPKPFSKMILSASGSKINGMLIRAYLQDGHSIPKADEVKKFQGALSWGKPGIYRNVKKVDAVSLYPSIIIQFNVCDFSKDPKGYILELVKIFRTKRLEYKALAAETGDNYWKEMDTTAKGILNSFFGFFGAPGLNFNSFDCAEFITGTGREILEKAIEWATGNTFQNIAPDYYESYDELEEA